MKVVRVPTDWAMPVPNLEMGEPRWDRVDNPGNCHGYSFRPKFGNRKGKRNTSFIICHPDVSLFLQAKIANESGMVGSTFKKDGKPTIRTEIMD